jgi:NTP pyrophosphatase (non-canonical NTP hydrolase)
MIHNVEELAELQKEISKWARGYIRQNKLEEEIKDVLISIENIQKWLKIKGLKD